MRTESFHADDLAKALRRSKIATMPELKRALGTEVDVTVFRKLKQLAYRTSYSHRGGYYTLDETAHFDQSGLWSFQSVWFSRQGTLLDTAQAFVEDSSAGYFAEELDHLLHVGTKEPLLKLVQHERVAREPVGGLYLYCSMSPVLRERQLLARHVLQAEPNLASSFAKAEVVSGELKAAACAQAQTPQTLPPAGSSASGQASPAPDQQPAATAPVVTLSILPMAPPDLDSPYASPRDAARHWFQTTLANLREQHDIRGAVRGFSQALLLDRTYAAAAFNLGVLAAIDGKWEDAATALEEASRLDHAGLGAEAKPHLERSRLLALLERSAEGRRKRRYDEALYGLLPVLPNMAPSDAAASLVLVGRIDPARWEAPDRSAPPAPATLPRQKAPYWAALAGVRRGLRHSAACAGPQRSFRARPAAGSVPDAAWLRRRGRRGRGATLPLKRLRRPPIFRRSPPERPG